MKRRASTPRNSRGKLELQRVLERRRNILVDDLALYARSLHRAAKALAGSLRRDGNPVSDVDFSPVVNLYRQALELSLKALVLGDGGNFLVSKPDVISVHKTHSVSWLAQFVSQIVTAVGWQKEFRCEGIEGPDGFKALVESVNSVDPGAYTYRTFVDSEVGFDVPEFCRKLDAVLGLLDSTADALAAEWDFKSGSLPELDSDDDGFGTVIQ